MATLEATWPLPRLSTTIDDGIRIAPARDQYKKTQVFGTDELGMIPDKPITNGIWSEPHLSTSIVFDPDGDDGIYEIPSDPPGPGHAQTVTAFCDDNEDNKTTGVPSRLGLNLSDNDDGVDVVLSRHPGPGFIPSETRLSTLIVAGLDDGKLFEIPSKPLELGSGLLSP